MSDTPHVGDIGTTIRLIIKDDGVAVIISLATTKQIILRSPSGMCIAYDADFTTDGSDGKIEYVTATAFVLDEAGTWQKQAYIVLPTGEWSSDVVEFTVLGNL